MPGPKRTARTIGQVPALDGIRGLAILAVMVNHWIFITSGREVGPFPGGFLAVDLFLVLSGFLITATLLREHDRTNTIDFRQFAWRRIRRLLPPLVLFFAVHGIVVALIGDPIRNEIKQAVLALTFTGNWQQTFGHRPPFDLVHLWSLAVEGQMYLIWGAAVYAFRKQLVSPQRLALGLAAVIVALAVWRYGWYAAGTDVDALYTRTDVRADSILMGAFGAFVWRSKLFATAWAGIAGLGALVVSAAIWVLVDRDTTFTFSVGFSIVALCGVVIIWGVMEDGSPIRAVMNVAPLRLTGKISYSLYLWHLPMFVWASRAFPDIDDLVRFIGASIAAYLAATVSYALSEKPFLRAGINTTPRQRAD